MKTINFTSKEFLSSLLDKSKTQIIQKAWNDKLKCFWWDGKFKGSSEELIQHCKEKHKGLRARSYDLIPKPPKYKVKDEVKLMWNQRSKGDWFCRDCGGGVGKKIGDGRVYCEKEKKEVLYTDGFFNKTLGTVETTEVFEIEMWKTEPTFTSVGQVGEFSYNVKGASSEDLAKRGGFKSAEKMFKFFDKKYDLSSPKKFHVSRWSYK